MACGTYIFANGGTVSLDSVALPWGHLAFDCLVWDPPLPRSAILLSSMFSELSFRAQLRLKLLIRGRCVSCSDLHRRVMTSSTTCSAFGPASFWKRQAADWTCSPSGQRLIDLCCGTG